MIEREIPGSTIAVDRRIRLERYSKDDLDLLVTYLNDIEIYNNTILIPNPYKESDGKQFLEAVAQFEELNKRVKDWVIRKDGVLIGGLGILYNYGLTSHKSEIGYWLGRPYWGQGIMTRVLKAHISWIWKATELIRLEARVFLPNVGSQRVLDKLGFHLEGLSQAAILKDGEPKDLYFYSKLHPDFADESMPPGTIQ